MINVFILTFCRNLDLFYGTELIFKTLRTGFPNANIRVVDNASIPEMVPEIESLAKSCSCSFQQISGNGLQHHEFILNTLSDMASGESANEPLVFLDPDICLWKCCENMEFPGLMAGKLTPRFFLETTQTITMPRLHTSFLWIPSPEKLIKRIWKLRAARFDFEPFLSYSFVMNSKWYRFDTGASLYAAIPHKASYFSEEHLDYYDHIFCGSHLDWLYDMYDTEGKKLMSRIHSYAKEGNLKALKGVWKYQHEIFGRWKIDDNYKEVIV